MFRLFHPDAPIHDTDLCECPVCFRNFAEIMKLCAPNPSERNYNLFFNRYDVTGRTISEWNEVGLRFGLSACRMHVIVDSMWRRLAAYHLRKCKGIKWA